MISGMRSSFRVLVVGIVSSVAVAACGPELQTVTLVNQTNRAIERVFVYPVGAADHGPSRGALAAGASTTVRLKPGPIEVLGESAKVKIDEHTRDVPQASQQMELRAPLKVVFYDEGAAPAGLGAPGVFGIAFQLLKPKPAEAPAPDGDPGVAPGL